MKLVSKLAVACLLGGGLLAASAAPASAAIVCNGNGVCWHVKQRYAYAPGYGVVVHPDNWRWGPREHYVWREHPGRGYWRNGVWITF